MNRQVCLLTLAVITIHLLTVFSLNAVDELDDDDCSCDCDLNDDSDLNSDNINSDDCDLNGEDSSNSNHEDEDVIVVGEKRARGKMNSFYFDVHGLNLMLLTEETSTLESAKRARLEPTVPAPRSEAESSEFYLLLQFTHHDN